MLRRQTPTILLYGIGLALLLSLGFNGFLLMDQSAPQGQQPSRASVLLTSDSIDLQEQLQACSRDNHHKDSLIHVLVKVAHSPSDSDQALQAAQ